MHQDCVHVLVQDSLPESKGQLSIRQFKITEIEDASQEEASFPNSPKKIVIETTQSQVIQFGCAQRIFQFEQDLLLVSQNKAIILSQVQTDLGAFPLKQEIDFESNADMASVTIVNKSGVSGKTQFYSQENIKQLSNFKHFTQEWCLTFISQDTHSVRSIPLVDPPETEEPEPACQKSILDMPLDDLS